MVSCHFLQSMWYDRPRKRCTQDAFRTFNCFKCSHRNPYQEKIIFKAKTATSGIRSHCRIKCDNMPLCQQNYYRKRWFGIFKLTYLTACMWKRKEVIIIILLPIVHLVSAISPIGQREVKDRFTNLSYNKFHLTINIPRIPFEIALV